MIWVTLAIIILGLITGEDEVRCRLNRALATNSWLQMFPLSRVCHLNPSKSDRLPLLVEIRSSLVVQNCRSRRFHFEDMWLQGEGCENVIQCAWSSSSVGVLLFQVYEKIRDKLLCWIGNDLYLGQQSKKLRRFGRS